MKRIFFALAALLTLAAGCTKEIDPTSVVLDKHELTIAVGEAVTLAATIAPSNATNTAVNWSSSKPSVADVDKDGKVTAFAEGMASITVTTLAGGLTDACIIMVTSKPVPVTGVKLDKTSYEMTEGDVYQLSATVEPANATNIAVSWSSSNDEVASVDNLGYVRAHNEGKATITVRTEDGGFTAKCEVTVAKFVIPVTGISFQTKDVAVQKGESAQLQWRFEPQSATDTGVKFTSSNTQAVTVSADGKVMGVDYGNATVTITTNDGGFTDECTVNVRAVAEGVTVTPASVEVPEGRTMQLTATVSPAGATQTVEWGSNNSDVATVDENGLVTGVKKGNVRIVARSKEYPDIQGWCEVTVIQDPTLVGISFDMTELQLTVGQTYTLSVVYNPEYAANKNVSWTSSNEDVATVSAEGKIMALTEGTTTVTATSEEGGYTASCTVTVSKEEGTKVYYSFNSSFPLLYVNGELDPLSGTFDEYLEQWYKFRCIQVSCIYSEGPDLYTVEVYQNGPYYKDYLCKNRRPVCEMPFSSPRYDDAICMTERNGTVALVVRSSLNDTYYIIRTMPDGTSTTCNLTGSFKNSPYSFRAAIAPDGSIHITANITNSFGDYYLALYQYAPDGSLKETLMKKKNTAHHSVIDISEEGDIYILDKDNDDGHNYVLYKNGEVFTLINPEGSFNSQIALSISGGHIYVAIADNNNDKTTILRDGTVLYTLDDDWFNCEHPIQVTTSGDVYFASTYHIYKNGSMYMLSANENPIGCFAVVE
ncbi:MAG: Ig domain-containing protein [Bacteroidales bacterium]|nr:Ig domain-containing protein [Bacteroidales bacterium]